MTEPQEPDPQIKSSWHFHKQEGSKKQQQKCKQSSSWEVPSGALGAKRTLLLVVQLEKGRVSGGPAETLWTDTGKVPQEVSRDSASGHTQTQQSQPNPSFLHPCFPRRQKSSEINDVNKRSAFKAWSHF